MTNPFIDFNDSILNMTEWGGPIIVKKLKKIKKN
jgi:hypothetical protein